jgi:hypothetical protein
MMTLADSMVISTSSVNVGYKPLRNFNESIAGFLCKFDAINHFLSFLLFVSFFLSERPWIKSYSYRTYFSIINVVP